MVLGNGGGRPASSSHDTRIIDAISSVAGCCSGGSGERRAGLKHLGVVEFNTRWRNVKGVRRC
ncbi:MAG TPA: hypothetical protein VH641_03140 [Streptosporangiaceae bacterium]|jgi:hypothetical protein